MGTGGSFSARKQEECKDGHSSPCTAKVKNAWSYTYTPPYVFMAWYLVKPRDKFI
jgi:hypothetical protein